MMKSLLIATLVSFAGQAAGFSIANPDHLADGGDTQPPILAAFDFAPKSVDVSMGVATVHCTMTLRDQPAGVNRTSCQFNSPNQQQRWACSVYEPSTGDRHDGVWECDVTIPRFSEAGIWKAETYFSDEVGNDGAYSAEQLSAAGFPSELVVASVADVEAPILTAFNFAPKAVNVSMSAVPVHCTMTLRDQSAGVNRTSCQFNSPNQQQRWACSVYEPSTGDRHDGVWECDVMIPHYGQEGIWRAETYFTDEAGNDGAYSAEQLSAAGFPSELSVSSTPDVEAPTLADFVFTPNAVDVSRSAATVHCTMTLRDQPAGVNRTSCQFNSPNQQQRWACSVYEPSTGDRHDGVWECDVMIPHYGQEGIWRAETYFTDEAGNDGAYSEEELAQAGLPNELRVGFLPGQPRAAIRRMARRFRGERITLFARLIEGSPADVSPTLGVRFDYRALPTGEFAPIPAAGSHHPNPDTTFPYFIHWDVSSVAEGEYELRAVAHGLDGAADPNPEKTRITITRSQDAEIEEGVDTLGRQTQRMRVRDDQADEALSGDVKAGHASTEVAIPLGSLENESDTLIIRYLDDSVERGFLEAPEQSIGLFVETSLESGQSTLQDGVAAGLDISYSDADGNGVVDGTSVREEDLELRRFDEVTSSYVVVGSAGLVEHNLLHAEVSRLGRFALVGPPQPVVRFQPDRVTLGWGAVTGAFEYHVYRGDVGSLIDIDGDGLPDAGYGDCRDAFDPSITDTAFVDSGVPEVPATGYFYMVSFSNSSGEGGLGNTSSGLRRSPRTPCP